MEKIKDITELFSVERSEEISKALFDNYFKERVSFGYIGKSVSLLLSDEFIAQLSNWNGSKFDLDKLVSEFEVGTLRCDQDVYLFIASEKECISWKLPAIDFELKIPKIIAKDFINGIFEDLPEETIGNILEKFPDIKEEIGDYLSDRFKINPTQNGFAEFLKNSDNLKDIIMSIEVSETENHYKYDFGFRSNKFNREQVEELIHAYVKFKREALDKRTKALNGEEPEGQQDLNKSIPFINVFNGIKDVGIIKNHFRKLTDKKGSDGKPILTNEQLDDFIEAAFVRKSILNKIVMNQQGIPKKNIARVFKEFHNICKDTYEPTARDTKDKYLTLLTNYFENWSHKDFHLFRT